MFVTARYGALVRTAGLLLGGTGQAEDLVQAALLRTFLRWRDLWEPSNAEAYTRTVMARLAMRWARRHWTGERPTAILDPVAVEDQNDRFDTADEVARRLERLPAGQRAVLVLRFYEQLSEAEVAKALRCRPGTVKSRSARALAALRADDLRAPRPNATDPVWSKEVRRVR